MVLYPQELVEMFNELPITARKRDKDFDDFIDEMSEGLKYPIVSKEWVPRPNLISNKRKR